MKLNAFWVGELSFVERVCLSSAVAVGHEVDLWAYEPLAGVPAGVVLRNASEVMPAHRMLKHARTGSPGIGSDIFRLLLQQQARGCYIDCDMLFLQPMPDEPYIFGLCADIGINNAVLRLPASSPIVADMLALLESKPFVAPWWSWPRKLRQRARGLIGVDRPIERLKWGTTGPDSLTYFAERYGVAHHAKQHDVFYPYVGDDLFAPAEVIASRLGPSTIAAHLCNSGIGKLKKQAPPPGSWIAEQCARFGVAG